MNRRLFDILIVLPMIITLLLLIIVKIRDFFHDDNDIIGY